MPLLLDNLEKALAALEAVHAKSEDPRVVARVDEITRTAIRAGVIQHFEFTYELCWKFMKRWLETHVSFEIATGIPRRELFRLAAEHKLIADVPAWMRFHAARNETVHTYQPSRSEEVYVAVGDFIPAAKKFFAALQLRNE